MRKWLKRKVLKLRKMMGGEGNREKEKQIMVQKKEMEDQEKEKEVEKEIENEKEEKIIRMQRRVKVKKMWMKVLKYHILWYLLRRKKCWIKWPQNTSIFHC